MKHVPLTGRSLGLRILRHNVDDDHFLQIFVDLSKLIRTSAKLCAGNEGFAEDEVNYIEELLGLSFVLLQVKIQRVREAAKVPPLALSDALSLGGTYKNTGESLASLIWTIGNYYKHNDTWGSEEWSDDAIDGQIFSKRERDQIERARKTRRIVEKVGIIRGRSSGNMRTAYDFFEISWATDCTPLADKVQEWAKAVYEKCANL